MNERIVKHTFFWGLVTLFLTAYFGRTAENYLQSFYFTCFMLPVALATSYFFNYYLVPQFLISKKYWKFGLYFIYTLIISLYLEMLVMTLSFIVLGNYQYDKMNPLTVDIFTLTITLYLIVLTVAFARMIKAFQSTTQLNSRLIEEQEKSKTPIITVKSNRETVPVILSTICYIESMSDYVKIHTSGKTIITKEKIGKISDELPSLFIRVHRSFIVNKNLIDSFSKEKIHINGTDIPISRTYKKAVMVELEEKS
ncbi:MAG: LytTR family DNA-binding domain-containing protein [Cyclobacteriaceae bacterium]